MAGNRYLLDTNAIIALQRDNDALKNLLADADEVFVPVIAVGELYFGAYKSTKIEDNINAVIAFNLNRVILNTDQKTAQLYGLVKKRLRDKGRPIPENDIWIAAIALQYNLILLTRDAHFSEVEHLAFQSW